MFDRLHWFGYRRPRGTYGTHGAPGARGTRGTMCLLVTLSALPGAYAETLPAAQSQETLVRFAVPAQPLTAGLLQLGQQARISIAVPHDLVVGKSGPAVEGEMSVSQGLSKILARSGLSFEFVSPTAVRIFATALAGTDGAPSALDEILVTANKRPESQREVPIAITAMSQSTIQRLGPTSTEDAMRFVPGVNFSSNGGNSVNYTIRGVNTGAATGNVQSTVAVFVDDMSILDPYYPKITTNLRLFDVDRIEVLRGPQGTLFGSGALGGAIRLVTNKPNLENFEVAAETNVSSTDGGGAGYAVNGMVNMPVVDGVLAVRLVSFYERDPGYVNNIRTGERDVNRSDSHGGRVQLLYDPGDGIKITASVLVQNDDPADSAYTNYGTPGYNFNGYLPNRFPSDLTIYSVNGDFDTGFADLTSITNYADKHEYSLIDFTGTSMALTHLPGLATISDFGPSETFSEELRLTSKGDGRLQWLAGAMYLRNRRTVLEQAITDGAAEKYGTDYLEASDFYRVTDEAAVFGEVSYAVTDRLKLTAGVRGFRDQIHVTNQQGGAFFDPPSVDGSSTNEHAATPKFAATYTLSPEATVYAQAAKGYRIGQSNVGAQEDLISKQVIPAAYDPDSLWNYEIGTKTGFFDNRLTANAALYYIDWRNIQLASFTSGEGLNYISNAGDAVIRGAELELRAAPVSSIEFGSSLSYINSEMTSISNGAAGYVGQRLPASARLTASNYVQYSMPIASTRAYARIDQHFISSEIDRLGPGALNYGNYSEFNVRAGVDFGHYEVVAYLNNVANRDAVDSALAVNGVSVALREQPRTVGLTFRVHY